MIKKAFFMCLLLTVPGWAQVELQRAHSYAPPHFYFDALNFKTDSSQSRLDFYLEVPYSELQFLKSGNEFAASYEVFLQLTDDEGNSALEQTWEERVSCPSFDETLEDKIFSVSHRHFVVRPGSYTLQVTITDPETKGSYTARRNFIARNYSRQPESISDVMILMASTESEGRRTIVPNIQANVMSQKDFFPVFYEVYSAGTGDSVLASTRIFGQKDRLLFSRSEWLKRTEPVQKVFEDIRKDSIPMGVYRLSITLKRSLAKDAPILANATRMFSIHFPELPLTINDLDEAAEEMMYIADSKTIDSIKSAFDLPTKEKIFVQFWQRHSPNPSSKTNPVMEEYYNRVSYANQHFTHFSSGWKSDMGMVYILLGPPNTVDRHPFNVDSKPYEVWRYYQRNRTFVFVDQTGFGDYRLLLPIADGYPPPSAADFFGR